MRFTAVASVGFIEPASCGASAASPVPRGRERERRPVRPHNRYFPKSLDFSPSCSRPPSHSGYDKIEERISLCLRAEMAQHLAHGAGLARSPDGAHSLYSRLPPKPQSESHRRTGPAAATRNLRPYATGSLGSRRSIAPSGSRCSGSGLDRKEVLVIVKPDTVVRWHHKGFRLYWRWISKRGPGRPRVSKEVQALIRRFAVENGWGARKVHAELEKLGFTLSLATVSRYLPRRPPDRGQRRRWMTFLQNQCVQPKAGAFSGSQSRQGKSQEPCSLSRGQEGNQVF